MAKMYFVYSLLYSDSVFYIGCTQDMAKRYAAHLDSAKKSNTKTASRIREILNNNDLPQMCIIDYLPEDDAILLEGRLIVAFTKAGQPLTNFQFNRSQIRKLHNEPDIKTRKIMIKKIKHEQLMCAHQWNQHHNIFYQPPSNPF